MKSIIILISVGVASGVLGGMGMGGGTLLIPLLSIFCGVEQHFAQAINLMAFIPMSIVAIIFHARNHYIKLKGLWTMIIFGVLFAIIGSFVGKSLDGKLLKKIFGGFLIVLSVFQFFSEKIKKWLSSLKNKEKICRKNNESI